MYLPKPVFTCIICFVCLFLEPVSLFQSWLGSQTPRGAWKQAFVCLCCPRRWKGDYGGKKQLWFPANYVEEISPTAVEPDRSVSRVCLCLLLLCCVRGALGSDLYPGFLSALHTRSAGHREQSSGRSPERKCGRVFLSDRWVCVCVCAPLPWYTSWDHCLRPL